MGLWTSFLHSLKSIAKSFSICISKFASSLQFFKQFTISEHLADFCQVPNFQYHLLLHDESLCLFSFNRDLYRDFSYQSVDCLFTTFKHYFSCNTLIQSFVFEKTLSANNFYRSLKFPVLTKLSFTKKRLLGKKFRKKPEFL